MSPSRIGEPMTSKNRVIKELIFATGGTPQDRHDLNEILINERTHK